MTPAFTAAKGHVYELNGRRVIASDSGHVVEVRVLDDDGEVDHMIRPITVKATWLKEVEAVQ